MILPKSRLAIDMDGLDMESNSKLKIDDLRNPSEPSFEEGLIDLSTRPRAKESPRVADRAMRLWFHLTETDRTQSHGSAGAEGSATTAPTVTARIKKSDECEGKVVVAKRILSIFLKNSALYLVSRHTGR
jgi:hypothetical protein